MLTRLVFDHEFFHHVNQAALEERGTASRALVMAEGLLQKRAVVVPLALFEHILSFVLTLPIPIYAGLVFRWVNGMRGLPSMGGMYVRALYYRRKLKLMEPNVLIDQNVVFGHPEGVELKSFSYIDKNVILMSTTTRIGRRVHIAPKVFVTGGGDFLAEDYSCVATNTSIITATEVLKDGARCSGPMVSADQRHVLRGKVVLEKDAFIGAAAVLLTNVTVARGSVVGAGVVLAKSTEPWQIVVGSKATAIGERDPVLHPDN